VGYKKRGRTSENNRVTESLGDNTTTSKRARHNANLHHGGFSISKHAVACCCEYFNMITINGPLRLVSSSASAAVEVDLFLIAI